MKSNSKVLASILLLAFFFPMSFATSNYAIMQPIHHIDSLDLSNNDFLNITNSQYELDGALNLSGNSTLLLNNSTLTPTFPSWQFQWLLTDNAKLIATNGSVIGGGIFEFQTKDSALVNITDSELQKSIQIVPGNFIAKNSKIWSLMVAGSSTAQIDNCSITQLQGYGGNISITDSELDDIKVGNDKFPMYVYLTNTKYNQSNIDPLGKAIIYIQWHLSVSVLNDGQPMNGAAVEILSNNTILISHNTSASGQASFMLPEKTITDTGISPIANYTVKVKFGNLEQSESFLMDGNKAMSISLSTGSDSWLAIALPFFVIIGIVVFAVIIVLLLVTKKKKENRN